MDFTVRVPQTNIRDADGNVVETLGEGYVKLHDIFVIASVSAAIQSRVALP